MSYYYKYNFISPDRLYARIQEEMRSYFSTGAIDSVMFPIWTEDCIKKFRKSLYPIAQSVVCVKDGIGELPSDYKAIREAYSCFTTHSAPYNLGASKYYVKTCTLTEECDQPIYEIVYKVSEERVSTFTHTCLMKPTYFPQMLDDCPVIGGMDDVSYTIDGTCIKTSFQEGLVHLVYYTDGKDEDNYPMIPDDFFISDYILKYLKYQLMLQLFNQTTDETFNQVYQKLQMFKQDMNDAWVNAYSESISETREKRIAKIKKSYRRHDKYKL